MATYKRMNVYPSGEPIPKQLPDNYMPAAYGAPAGQNCFTCKYFKFTMQDRFCTRWQAPVKPKWWCDEWSTLWPTQ